MKDKTIICLSITDWDAPQVGSRQQIMKRLASKNRILYVEPPRALHSLVTDRRKSCLQWKRWMTGGLREGPDRMTVASPPPVCPFFYHPLTNAINQRIMIAYIRRTLKRLRWKPDIFWTYWPNHAAHVGVYGEETSVYHCTDNIMAARYPFTTPKIVSAMEETLAHRVDLVITRTQGLADRLAPVSRNMAVIRGGVDPHLFDPGGTHVVPEVFKGLKPPRVGMVATLDDRLDLPMTLALAKALPRVTFVLVGHVRGHLIDLSPLLREPNVHLLPAVIHDEVPDCIACLDVCLIPFLINAYTREVSPIKLYECLAMGKRVVTTRLPYVEHESGVVHIVDSVQDAIDTVRRCLDTPQTPEEKAALRHAAMPWTWENQVRRIEALLDRVHDVS